MGVPGVWGSSVQPSGFRACRQSSISVASPICFGGPCGSRRLPLLTNWRRPLRWLWGKLPRGSRLSMCAVFLMHCVTALYKNCCALKNRTCFDKSLSQIYLRFFLKSPRERCVALLCPKKYLFRLVHLAQCNASYKRSATHLTLRKSCKFICALLLSFCAFLYNGHTPSQDLDHELHGY